jgi:hypothetical protein
VENPCKTIYKGHLVSGSAHKETAGTVEKWRPDNPSVDKQVVISIRLTFPMGSSTLKTKPFGTPSNTANGSLTTTGPGLKRSFRTGLIVAKPSNVPKLYRINQVNAGFPITLLVGRCSTDLGRRLYERESLNRSVAPENAGDVLR